LTRIFFAVGEDIIAIALEWVNFLLKEKLYSLDAPVFPRNRIGYDNNQGFVCTGIAPLLLSDHKPDTLVRYGMQECITTEKFKAWSQNLGNASTTITTFNSYGGLDTHKQVELTPELGAGNQKENKLVLILEVLKEKESYDGSIMQSSEQRTPVFKQQHPHQTRFPQQKIRQLLPSQPALHLLQ
jgi:hypothetical protein